MAGAAARGGPARAGAAAPAHADLATALVLALAGLLCLGAVVAAAALGPVTVSADSPLDRLRLGEGALGQAGAEEAATVREDATPLPEGGGGIPAEVVLSMAVVVVAGALLARSLLRARPDEGTAQDEEPEDEASSSDEARLVGAVADAARRGLERLRAAPPGAQDGTVLACWVELEDAGSRTGAGRARTDTPSDFADRLAAAVPGLDRAVLDDLRRTYSRVRFGSEGARPGDVEQARAALEQLLAALEAHPAPAVRR